MKTKTDERGIEYVDPGELSALPTGWALCGTCGRAWNDAKPTAWTPAPSARCPFESEHDEREGGGFYVTREHDGYRVYSPTGWGVGYTFKSRQFALATARAINTNIEADIA